MKKMNIKIKGKRGLSILTSTALVSVLLGVGISYALNPQNQNSASKLERTQSFERTVATKSSGIRRLAPSGQEFLDYSYAFNDESFATIGEESRKRLFGLDCYDGAVETYKRGESLGTNDADGKPLFAPAIKENREAYICENNILRFESFSKLFNGGHTLYSIVNSMRDGNYITLPLYDDMQSVRIHSDARQIHNNDPTRTAEYYVPEVTPVEVSTDTGPSGAAAEEGSFSIWGRWAEAVYSRSLVFSNSQTVKIEKFSSQRWLSMFFDYFSGSQGPSCLNIWKDFDGLNYIWNTLFAHEMYHHFISPSIREESDEKDPQIDYSFYKVSGKPPSFTSKKKTEKIRKSLWDVTSSYFSSLKTPYWNNSDIASSAADRVKLNATFGNKKVEYELAKADLQYIYEPEELVTRLMSLLTFYWEDLDPGLLELDYTGFDICRPSFFMKDYLSFNNSSIDINPFKESNFKNAVGLVLNYLKFDKKLAYIKKGNANSGGVSFQGWSKPGEHQKLVLEEINPSSGSIATKRNIVDLSWSASNFFVRESFNNPKKKYVECSDDLSDVTLVDNWASSCQMWTTPLIDVNGLFDRFSAPSTDEVNIYTDTNSPLIGVGFNAYFWSDQNGNGLIEDIEKTLITTTEETSLNARLQKTAPGTDCKISLFTDEDGTKLVRYVGDSYASSLNVIDTICKESWTKSTTTS